MDAKHRQFLSTLAETTQHGRASTDQHDVGNRVGLTIEQTDALVAELQADGYVEVVGIGGDIRITAEGVQAMNSK